MLSSAAAVDIDAHDPLNAQHGYVPGSIQLTGTIHGINDALAASTSVARLTRLSRNQNKPAPPCFRRKGA
jgi:hypothetical protein